MLKATVNCTGAIVVSRSREDFETLRVVYLSDQIARLLWFFDRIKDKELRQRALDAVTAVWRDEENA